MSWEGTLFNSEKRVAREHNVVRLRLFFVHVYFGMCVFVCGMCVLMREVILLVSLA